jgi:hypothetical protein
MIVCPDNVERHPQIDPGAPHAPFWGNYSAYLEARLCEAEKHHQMYTDQQEEIARLRRALVIGEAAFGRGGKGDSGDKFARVSPTAPRACRPRRLSKTG